MISKLLRKWVFEKELGKSTFNKQLDESFKINKITIIVDPTTAVDSKFFLNLAKMFKISELQISLLLLNNNSELEKQYQQIFNPQEVNFWGSFKGDLLIFCESEYDLMINYYNKIDYDFSLISVRTNHKISVGFSGADARINDVVFDFDPKDKETFKKELLKYMTILNKI